MAQGTEPLQEGGRRGHKSGREARMEGGLCYLAVRAARASKPWKVARPWGCVASSATSVATPSKLTVAARRPSKPPSRAAASRPASSASKARKTREQQAS